MKRYTLITALFLCPFLTFAQQDIDLKDDKGFSMSMDWGLGKNYTNYEDYGTFQINVSAGYKFSNYFNLRGGVGINHGIDYEAGFVPIFTEIECIPTKNKFSSYFGLKLGSIIDVVEHGGNKGVYLCPQIGIAMDTNDNCNMIFFIGSNLASFVDDQNYLTNYDKNQVGFIIGVKGVIWK